MANQKYRLHFRRLRHFDLLAGFAVVSLAVAPYPAKAAADAWTVAEQTGTSSHLLPDGRSLPLKTGDIVAEGESVQTGPNGHLVLLHHGHADTMTVSPGSQFRIPDTRREGTLVNVVESMGSLLFNIEHTPGRRFEVNGPYLAAVVKGTSFTVEVAASGNTVNVTQGAVEVQSRDTHQVALVRPGQFAMVSASGRHELSLGTRPGSAVPVPGSAGQSSSGNRGQSGQASSATFGDTHLDIGALTNNLVTNAASATPTVTSNAGARSIPGNAGLATTSLPAAGAPVPSGNSGLALALSGATLATGAVTPPGPAGVTPGSSPTRGSSGNGVALGLSSVTPGTGAVTPPGLGGVTPGAGAVTPPGLGGVAPGSSSTGGSSGNGVALGLSGVTPGAGAVTAPGLGGVTPGAGAVTPPGLGGVTPGTSAVTAPGLDGVTSGTGAVTPPDLDGVKPNKKSKGVVGLLLGLPKR